VTLLKCLFFIYLQGVTQQEQTFCRTAVTLVFFNDEFDRELLWGVSARITVDFLAVLAGSDLPAGG